MSFLSSRTRSARQGFGKPVLRQEDPRLLAGQGCYSDDFNLPRQAYACMVRSPHAHARIRRIDAVGALQTAGVIAVFTGEDAAADGLRPIPHRPVPANPHEVPLRSRDGSPFFIAPHPPLPVDRARFVGEAVAMVIAETPAAARDGAERVAVDWDALPAVTASADATAVDAPIVWQEAASNVCVDSEAGDAAAADTAFRRADYVVRLETRVNRVTGVPMEPRAALAVWDEATGRHTLYAGSGGVQRIRSDLAGVLGVPESAVRVVAREVGGNYGTRNSFYPEFALVAWAARRLRRPVKWTCERREALLTDYQSRDLVSRAALALDVEDNFLAFRGVNTSNVGAHAVSFIPLAKGVAVSTSVYDVPVSCMRGRAVLSHTSPTTPYRAAGRPEDIELNTGMPRERAEITVRPEGRIDVVIGTLSAGQGHETSFAQLIAEWFDVEVGQVRLITGDTDVASVGGGSHSGRSMRLAGVVMAKASDQIVDKGRRIAAWLLEAAETDLDFSESRFTVRGTDRGVHLFAAAAAALRADAPETLRGPLAGAGEETMSVPSYPYGATGQMQSAATFMDYALPRADLFPPFATEISEVPSTSNPLGLRGGGEGGTTPALGAVINAIVDALAELGVEHIEMPATPERVWRAIQDARR